MTAAGDVLLTHRWNPGKQTCMCHWGTNLRPLGSPRAWAEHVVEVLAEKGMLSDDSPRT